MDWGAERGPRADFSAGMQTRILRNDLELREIRVARVLKLNGLPKMYGNSGSATIFAISCNVVPKVNLG